MSRVELVEVEGADRLLRRMFGQMEKSYGAVPYTARALAQIPSFVSNVAGLGSIEFHEGELPMRLKLIAKLRVAQLNKCAFCIDSGTARAQKEGLTSDKIQALSHPNALEQASWSDEEQLILQFTDASARMEVSDALFAKMKEHFSEPQMIELTAQIAVETFYNVINHSLGIQSQGFCSLPNTGE